MTRSSGPGSQEELPRLLDAPGDDGEYLQSLLKSAAIDEPQAEQLEHLVASLDSALSADNLGDSVESGGGSEQLLTTGGLSKAVVGLGVLAAVVGVSAWALLRPSSEVVPRADVPHVLPVPPQSVHHERELAEETSLDDKPSPQLEQQIVVGDERPPGQSVDGSLAQKPLEEDASPPEVTFLARAQDALRNRNGSLALAVTREHQRTYPAGQYREEMERIAIESLLLLGDRETATRRAAKFRQDYPSSVHRQRLDALLK